MSKTLYSVPPLCHGQSIAVTEMSDFSEVVLKKIKESEANAVEVQVEVLKRKL